MLAEGESIIENFAPCGDSLAALRVAEELGCAITLNNTDLHIIGVGTEAIAHRLNSHPTTIHTAESGLLTRLIIPIAATLSNGAKVEITGEGTLTARPLTESIDALHKAGAKVVGSGEQGVLVPLEVCGPITTPNIVIDGSRSSQVASGLMIALPLLPEGTTLTIERPTSVPYLHLTEQMVAAFGCSLAHTEDANFIKYQVVKHGTYVPTHLHLESDWSSAGYFAAAYALAQSGAGGGKWVREEYSLEGMSRGTAQADEVIVEILRGCGANIVESADGAIRFLPSSPLQAFEVDATHYPDLVPTLAVVALWAEGVSRIGGLHRLATKESNRAEALLGELKALGAHITIEGDRLRIEGCKPLHAPIGGAPLRSYGDHRMVMALAVVSLFVAESLRIDSTEGVAKSFPSFFEKFQR
jgi:3-phosphoshikimate 1-carboxyvinyltransferase